jgi:polyisoprenoid-binding protein YceI
MKKTAILATFAATLLFSACNNSDNTEDTTVVTAEATASNEGETYAVVSEQSSVNWNGKKVVGEHSGEINLQGGELNVNGDQVTGGTLVIDMNTITNTDLTDPEYNGQLVGHLKSDDFFGVEKYPTATFTITNIAPIANAAAGNANYNVTGDLTIKDKTEQVSFPATINIKDGVATAKADVTVDRTKYDIRYGSSNFFDDLGDKAIDNNFTVSFDVTARK